MSARDSDPTSDAGYTTAGVAQTGPIKIEKLSYLREESIYDWLGGSSPISRTKHCSDSHFRLNPRFGEFGTN